MKNKYYSLETSGNEADLYIFGDITSWPWDEKDKDAYSIVKDLQALEATTVNVHINSYGGEVAEGLAIHNVLKNSKAKVVTYCDGFACSAASVIFMAGDERIMNEASLLMIHNAWSYAAGNANEFRKQAEDLDKITQASINAYMARVSITEDEVKELMDNESWLTADEALTYGFATSVLKAEDTESKMQSAFLPIRNKLISKSAEELIPDQIAEAVVKKLQIANEIKIDTDQICGKIVEMLSKNEEVQEPEHPTNSWDAFFKSKNKEKR